MSNKTKAREIIINILKEADQPISVKDIETQLNILGLNIWTSTIYRILNKLEKENIIFKSYINESNSKLFVLVKNKHIHYAICLNCDKMLIINRCPMILDAIEENLRFNITGHKLEFYGYCEDCKLIE